MRSNVVAEASAIGRLTSTVLKSSAREEIMNDGESKVWILSEFYYHHKR